MSYNVIGDIAGNFKTLQALIAKMPKGKIISVGDMIDRGPRSKEVLEYFMNTPDTQAILGNHEHMMLDSVAQKLPDEKEYDYGIWEMNGGNATLRSFNNKIPNEIVQFVSALPTSITLDLDGKSCYISHAFDPGKRDRDDPETEIFGKIWNRRMPIFVDGGPDIQICGHNSQFGLRYWTNYDGRKGICIDSSAVTTLTGIHLPTMTIYQQEYID